VEVATLEKLQVSGFLNDRAMGQEMTKRARCNTFRDRVQI